MPGLKTSGLNSKSFSNFLTFGNLQVVFKSLLLVMLFGSPLACQKSPTQIELTEITAAKTIEQSFLVKVNPALTTHNFGINSLEDLKLDKQQIQIQKTALEKEFLFQVSIIPQASAAMSSGLKSRIVAFRQRANKVYLLEATSGHSVTHDLPQNLVLAEFPILSETESALTIDFNQGMSHLFIASEWRGSDFDSKHYSAETEFASIPLQFAFIEDARFNQNHLIIRQVAQLTPAFGSPIPVESKYYLSPYQASENFDPTRGLENFDRLGFFETAPLQRINQDDIRFATKFNKNKKIIFAVSANTPDDFKQAVKDGILYWNQAFDSEAIQVVDAPTHVTAPDLNYNVVQWVNFDNAGFAYADAQVDPRTGETLHTQIYLTSAFAVGGKLKARFAIRNWENQLEKKQPLKNILGLRGFVTEPSCRFEMDGSFVKHLRQLIQINSNDQKILKAAQDYVREVTAHEVGHTLGLRHNFAGSLTANYTLAEREQHINNYFQKGEVSNAIIPSSSVMEYQLFEDSILTGDKIAKKAGILPYDQKAIRALYLGEFFADEEIPLFCTDSHVGTYADCARFDIGQNYLQAGRASQLGLPQSVALDLLERFIYAKAPSNGEVAQSVKKVFLPNPKRIAGEYLTPSFNLMNSLTEEFRLLSVYRAYPVVDFSNKELVTKSQNEYWENQIQINGGFSKLLSGDGTLDIDETKKIFKKLLEENKKGIGFANQEYEFSNEELAWIEARTELFFDQIKDESFLGCAQILSGKINGTAGITASLNPFIQTQITDELADFLLARALQLIFAETGDKSFVEISVPPATTNDTPKKLSVVLPTYKYNFAVRRAAAEFLKEGRSQSLIWGIMQRKILLSEVKNHGKSVLTVELDSLKPEDMPTTKAALWLQENQIIGLILAGLYFK
jgi:hypothetical protein